jgi:hypothetical protein
MAYLIFNSDNNLVKIASSDLDKDSQNIVLADHTVRDVSDSDFLKVKTEAYVTYDGTNITITDTEYSFSDEESLKVYLKNVVSTLTRFLSENNDNSLYINLNNYKEYLETFDTSSVTFPLNKSWEKYCNENSITFYHPLQIP